jgi:hypothetical protein
MIREKITVQDYERISGENEYYIWHFVRKTNMGPRAIYSVFDEPNHNRPNGLKTFLEMCEVPYFESYVEDSADFIDNLIPLSWIWNEILTSLNKLI